ncbi:MAG TPA: single-stranded DNA-binding protein [Pyrinomonadaceae bacterium]|nr:single-stranded DNA-binding protein [Pyrinomonadaceae bacterium]
MSFNKIIVVGNLGRDPELRYTPQGTAVCSFTMATNERRKDKAGEQQDVTTWFKVTVWGKQAETVSQYLTKGRRAYVEGRLRVEEWTDRDGKTRHTLEVNATDVHFIDSAQGVEGIPVNQSSRPAESASAARAGSVDTRAGGGRHTAPEIEDDEIPF